MRTTSYSELRKTLAATLDKVTNDHEPVIITRDRGKPAAVLMSLEDFASYEETLHLLRSPKNADRLLKAIAELDSGSGTERALLEPAAKSTKKAASRQGDIRSKSGAKKSPRKSAA